MLVSVDKGVRCGVAVDLTWEKYDHGRGPTEKLVRATHLRRYRATTLQYFLQGIDPFLVSAEAAAAFDSSVSVA
eukprot:327350-Hanusia_phi.AAC.1